MASKVTSCECGRWKVDSLIYPKGTPGLVVTCPTCKTSMYSLEMCLECGKTIHKYWWDCKKLPNIFDVAKDAYNNPRRTHGIVFKGDGWSHSDSYKRDKGQDGE